MTKPTTEPSPPTPPNPVTPPTPTNTAPPANPSSDNSLAIVSMVLGIISLTGPGLLLGIPAIITGAIALKKNKGERGLSITGLVTGIVSTVVSLLVVAFFVYLFIWGINHPQNMYEGSPESRPGQTEQMPDSSKT